MTRAPISVLRAGQHLLVAAGLMGASVASASELDALNGRWRGSGLELWIDTDRLQANTDPAQPFTRQPLVIRNITGPMVFFSIGRDSFIARADSETMSVTRLGSSGTVQLTRVR